MGEWDAFDRWSESECECRCGTVFRSHARSAMTGATAPAHIEVRSRKPCPGCGRSNDLRRVSSDPETFTTSGAALKGGADG